MNNPIPEIKSLVLRCAQWGISIVAVISLLLVIFATIYSARLEGQTYERRILELQTLEQQQWNEIETQIQPWLTTPGPTDSEFQVKTQSMLSQCAHNPLCSEINPWLDHYTLLKSKEPLQTLIQSPLVQQYHETQQQLSDFQNTYRKKLRESWKGMLLRLHGFPKAIHPF